MHSIILVLTSHMLLCCMSRTSYHLLQSIHVPCPPLLPDVLTLCDVLVQLTKLLLQHGVPQWPCVLEAGGVPTRVGFTLSMVSNTRSIGFG